MNHAIHLFGRRAAVEADNPHFFDQLAHHLPQTALIENVIPGGNADVNYRIIGPRSMSPHYLVLRKDRTVAGAMDVVLTCEYFVRDLYATLGRIATGWTLIHAGVVEMEQCAVLLPGLPRAGKTTLVDALLRLGARYGSDELAAVDTNGRVHAHARPLGIRGGDVRKSRMKIVPRGQVMTDAPIPGAVVFTWFDPDASFAPTRMTPADVALKLLDHCLGARGRPSETLATLSAISNNAEGWSGPRGDAEETALNSATHEST